MADVETVVIAMSGGVDSSVAAALLLERGYRVIGMMLRLWSEPGREESNRCCTPDSMAQARRVAANLKIPFYAVDAKQRFRDTVVEAFLDGYLQGETPNPCVVCNRQIRWGYLYEQARAMGADYLATGHYVRVDRREDGQAALMKGIDLAKDQSYVLSVLSQEQLQHSIFPIGEMKKTNVREKARQLGLSVAERPESQDLCFLAGEDYRTFLARYAPQAVQTGQIVNREGQVIGEHRGLAFYTIGQRKGLGISAPTPLYVLAKKMDENLLVVGEVEELGLRELWAGDVNWITGEAPEAPFSATIKIRYKAIDAPGVVIPLQDGRVKVEFDHAMRDITAGQRAVFYQKDFCLGGGKILA